MTCTCEFLVCNVTIFLFVYVIVHVWANASLTNVCILLNRE